jgi:hypothetical protein
MDPMDFSRCETMSDSSLVRWAFILAHTRRLEQLITELTHNTPDGRLAAAQDACKAELAKRTAEKGGQEP